MKKLLEFFIDGCYEGYPVVIIPTIIITTLTFFSLIVAVIITIDIYNWWALLWLIPPVLVWLGLFNINFRVWMRENYPLNVDNYL